MPRRMSEDSEHASAPGKLGYRATALDALRGTDLLGKVAVVTGGNSGIGLETCRALAYAGADVVLCSRSVEAGERVAAELQPGVKGKISVRQLDLADLASVKMLGADLAASLPRLDLLILNAGIMACPKGRTVQGFEMQMGVNHLAHMYLTQLLLPKMKAQGTPGRVISVASIAHTMVPGLPLHDLNHEKKRPYLPWVSYAQSKLANVLFVKELARRLGEEGSVLMAFSVHPGVINTNLNRHKRVASFFGSLFAPLMKTVEQGAACTVYAATAPELQQHNGAYIALCRVGRCSKAARDGERAKALWLKSEELLAAALARAGL